MMKNGFCSPIRPNARRALVGLSLAGGFAAATAAAPQQAASCRSIDDDRARLACYDQTADRAAAPAAAKPRLPAPEPLLPAVMAADAQPNPAATGAGISLSALSTTWELDESTKRGTFNLLPHKLNYLLGVNYTTRANTRPSSPSPNHTVPASLSLQQIEAKYQLSLKTKLVQDVFGDNGDIWLAYTQQSYWQLYNSRQSSPFRTTDYEPEAYLTLRTNVSLLGWDWRLLNLGAVHQSNGSGLPFSRSWNRLYAQFGFENGNWSVLARPWWRIRENAATDDNPDIGSYLGSGDLRLTYARAGHVVSALGRYSTTGKRGGAQLDWAFPISKGLKGYVQATTGYGASLIDYNHAQTTFGAGIVIVPW